MIQRWGLAGLLMGDTRGMTLVEAMMASAIGVMILGVLMLFQVGGSQITVMNLTQAEMNSYARLVMDKIVRDTRWSTGLETTWTVSGTTYVTTDDELVLEIPAIDSSGEMVDGVYDHIVYALDASEPTTLRRLVDPDALSDRESKDDVVATNVTVFSLTSGGVALSSLGDPGVVTALEVSITVSRTPLQGRTATETLNSEVKLRNI